MNCIYNGISIQNQRKSNMDGLLLKTKENNDTPLYLAAVCDGVGSTENGGIAASITIHTINEWLSATEQPERLGLGLCSSVMEANNRIVAEMSTKAGRGASTLSALLLHGDSYWIAHVGDSRIYLFRDRTLRQLTPDQVTEGKLFSYLGKRDGPDVVYREGESRAGDIFLLCSDGLYKRMDDDFLLNSLLTVTRKNIKKAMEKMIQYVVEHGENDNISVAIIIRES